MSFAAPFLLSVGVLMTEVTMMIMVLMLIYVIIDTVFMTVTFTSTKSLVITRGLYEQQVFFIIVTIQCQFEEAQAQCSTLSLP